MMGKDMNRSKNYFDKNGFIYGISYGFNFGTYKVYELLKFNDFERALLWLSTEQGQFKTRELVSKSRAIKECGLKWVNNAYDLWGVVDYDFMGDWE